MCGFYQATRMRFVFFKIVVYFWTVPLPCILIWFSYLNSLDLWAPKQCCFTNFVFGTEIKFCFTFIYLDARFLKMSSIEMSISRSNKETLQWLKEISWRGMTQEKLTGEADSYFGVVKTNRPETVRAKISDFVNKEHNMRQSEVSNNESTKWWGT